MQEPQMLKTKAVAERLGVSPPTVRALVKAGTLPALRVSTRCYRFDARDVARFVADRRTGDASA